MEKKYVTLLLFIGVLAADFYLLPLMAKDTGTAMLLMLCVMPLIALIAAILYGVRNGFHLLLPIAAALLFLPTIFLYYNVSAWVYAAAYAVVVFIGNGIGRAFYGKS